MAIILKPLFELLTGDINIFDNVLYNYIFLGVLGVIVYFLSYGIVGKFYDFDMIDGRAAGSIAHWAIRLLLYVAAVHLFRVLIWIYTFIASVPTQIWWALSIVLLVCLILFVTFQIIKRTQPKQPTGKN